MLSTPNNRKAVLVAFIALFVALVGNATTLYVAEKADAKLCLSAQENRAKIRQTISGSDPTLLKPGDPGYTYYQTHPEEKAALKARIVRQLNLFPPIDCS